MRAIHDRAGDPPLRRSREGFEGLARIIVGQQLSVASAAAIWGRTQALLSPFAACSFQRLDDRALRGAGLSRSKIKTLQGLCQEVVAGRLNLDNMAALSDEEIHARLTRVSGIGPWTADIYVMFCLGRADAWAAGDLALQIAVQRAMALPERPSPQELAEIAEAWRPWRAVAARLLWSYYALAKASKSGAPL